MIKPEWISGNIFIRPNPLPKKGNMVLGHKHNFDHTTIVFTGSVHVKAKLPDGRVIEKDFVAPSHFLVKADVEHEIVALEDGTEFWCVYSHRDPQARITEHYTGWDEAYK
jgi:hypothetical protein